MADQTLVVPGTQATNLVDAAGITAYNAVRVAIGLSKNDLGGRPPTEWRALLSMEHAPGQLEPVRTSLSAGTTLEARAVVRTPYDRWGGFTFYPYDWRADIRWNALRLIDYLKANRPPQGDRWNLVGHSQGGLVILAASKLIGTPDDFARLVARVVLVGAPVAGTMRATDAIMFGRADLGEDQVLPLRAAARTWPALYQMLPAWDAAVQLDDTPLPSDRQLTQPGGWPGEVGKDGGIVLDLLQRGRDFQTLLKDPLDHLLPQIKVLTLMGKRQDTGDTVRWDGTWFHRPFNFIAGDTLVPAKRTVEVCGVEFGNTVAFRTGNVREHAWLCIDEQITKDVAKFLKKPAKPAPASII